MLKFQLIISQYFNFNLSVSLQNWLNEIFGFLNISTIVSGKCCTRKHKSVKKNEKEIMPLLCFGLIKDVLQKYAFGNDKIQNK